MQRQGAAAADAWNRYLCIGPAMYPFIGRRSTLPAASSSYLDHHLHAQASAADAFMYSGIRLYIRVCIYYNMHVCVVQYIDLQERRNVPLGIRGGVVVVVVLRRWHVFSHTLSHRKTAYTRAFNLRPAETTPGKTDEPYRSLYIIYIYTYICLTYMYVCICMQFLSAIYRHTDNAV